MILFNRKFDPIIRLKLNEKEDKPIPAIIMLKEPLSKRLKNSISKNRGKIKYEYKYLNAAAIELYANGIDKISEYPEVACICYDRKADICMDRTPGIVGIDYSNPYGLTGRGTTIAIIDTGVYTHGDLIRPHKAILAFKDFVNACTEPYDDNGHGTHLCGVMAGSGVLSDGKYRGIAVNSKIIMLKAFNNVGEGSFSDILAAIGWVIENKAKYDIKVLCLPFGAEAIVPHKKDPLSRACETAWNMGLIVVAAAGNKGPHQGTITTPGICPSIITVGCCDCRDTSIRNWRISAFSGRGWKKDEEVKPDIIAPGMGITSTSADKNYFPGKGGYMPLENPYCTLTGSSVSSAVAAGCIALILEKMKDISGKDLKGILKLSCRTLNEPKPSQGYGLINLEKLLNG